MRNGGIAGGCPKQYNIQASATDIPAGNVNCNFGAAGSTTIAGSDCRGGMNTATVELVADWGGVDVDGTAAVV
jgi:hypothetical protein